LPLIGLLKLFVPVQLLFALRRLEFAEVMSDRNARLCIALFLSSNCRCVSLFSSQMSPKAGFDGTAPVSGTFNDAYPMADGASFWAPPVNMFPPARFALPFSAAVARVVSAVIAELRLPSAVIARVVSPAIAVFRVFRSLVKPVTWFSLTLPVIVLAVPVTLPLIGLLKLFVPVQLLFALRRLEFAEVMSEKNARLCVAFVLSRNCR